MAEVVRYKQPRAINFVSVTLAVLLVIGGWAGLQHLDIYMRSQEAYRVLEDFGSQLAGRARMYQADHQQLEALRERMKNELRNIGVSDPKAEFWIEFSEAKEVRLGVLYSEWFTWPADVLEKSEHVKEIEHVVHLP